MPTITSALPQISPKPVIPPAPQVTTAPKGGAPRDEGDRYEKTPPAASVMSVAKPMVATSRELSSAELDQRVALLGNALIPDSLSRDWAGFPPLAYAGRESKRWLMASLLASPDINVGARDNRTGQMMPFKTVLMHTVRGALLNKSTGALEELLAHKHINGCLSDVVYFGDKRYTALDFPLQILDADPKSIVALGIAATLMAKGAEPREYGYVISEHPILSKFQREF